MAREAGYRDFSSLTDAIRADGIEAVAVCLLHSYAHPQHERAVAARPETMDDARKA